MLSIMATGCMTTTAISARDGTPVPKERLLAYQEPDSKRTIPIAVTRDTGLLGGACNLEFWIDDTKVAIFDTGEVATFYIEPNEHIFEVNWDQQGKGLCMAPSTPNHHTTYAREGKRKVVYRLRIVFDKPMISYGG